MTDGKFQKARRGLMAAAVVSAVVGMASASRASTILFDADGTGTQATPTAIGGFTLSSGNTLSVGSVPLNMASGQILPLLYQATINGFTNPAGDPIANPTGLNSTYELTLVLRFNEVITAASFDGSGNPVSARFSLSPNQTGSFLEIYSSAVNSSASAGTGFNDGRLIFQGLPSASLDNNGGFTFQAQPYPTGTNTALDQFGNDDHSGVTTLLGSGSAKVGSVAQLQDSNFFLTRVSQITLNGNLNLPFSQTNPSNLFDPNRNTTGLGTAGLDPSLPGVGQAGVSSVGTNNGTSGPNFIFQTIANASLQAAAVPEPATFGMTLIGVGGLIIGMARARRRNATPAA